MRRQIESRPAPPGWRVGPLSSFFSLLWPASGAPASGGASATAAIATLTAMLLCVTILGLVGCDSQPSLSEIRAMQAAGNNLASLEPLRQLLAQNPDDPEVLYLYGRALSATGSQTEALWALRAAMQHPEWLAPAGKALAAGAYRTQNHTVALAAIEPVLAADPDDVDALLIRAQAHAASRLNWELALADADRVLELDPDNLHAREPRILALLALERIDEAGEAMLELGELIEGMQVNPGMEAWHCATMAIFAEDSGEQALASERWEACVERFPAEVHVIYKVVPYYEKRGQWDRSLEVLGQAVAAAPNSIGYRLAYAERLRAKGRIDDAERIVREATALDDVSLAVGGWLGLVTHFQAIGEYGAAARASEQAIALAEKSAEPLPQLYFDYADALVLAGELEAAAEVAEGLTVPAQREMILARVRLEQDRPAESLEHFSEAFRLWPDNAFARYYAAIAAERAGDFDRAIEEYRYSIRIDPAATDARQRLARLHAAENEIILALQALRTKAEESTLDLDGELLSLRLLARAGQLGPLRALLERFRQHPTLLAEAVAATAEGIEARAGAKRAVEALKTAKEVELDRPRDIAALRALVELAHRAGEPEQLEPILDAALAKAPESATLYAVIGLDHTLGGKAAAEARVAYEHCLSLDPANVLGLVGLANLQVEESPEEALALYERALEVDAEDASIRLRAARVLRALGRTREAEEQLDVILTETPYDAAAAIELVRLRLAGGDATDEELDLVNTAVRFGGGAAAKQLQSEMQGTRGQVNPSGQVPAAGPSGAAR